MIFKTYQIYLGKIFTSTLLKTFFVFLSLAFILNIFEEINFFKDLNVSITIPIFLTFLNIPSILFDIFPFMFLIAAQFAFIKLMDQDLGLKQYCVSRPLATQGSITGLFGTSLDSSRAKHSPFFLRAKYQKQGQNIVIYIAAPNVL